MFSIVSASLKEPYSYLNCRRPNTKHRLTQIFSNRCQTGISTKRSFATSTKESIGALVEKELNLQFPEHPFASGITKENAQKVMCKYLAMSQAFPFIQSSAYAPLIKQFLANNEELPEAFNKTFAVAMFLCNDEMGSHHILSNGGNKRLPEILQTEGQTHANMLKKDLLTLFGKPCKPDVCPVTMKYLMDLMESLGSDNIEEMVASMVAFENHAHHMIQAVWDRIHELYPHVDKESLEYFKIHVGGDDPAEAYHVQMTEQLILETKASVNTDRFMKHMIKQYTLSANWCRDICLDDKDGQTPQWKE